MKKFECNACGVRICAAEYQSGSGIPFKCTAGGTESKWHEVKDEIERPAKAKLPDWVKERAIGYDNEQDRYFEVMDIDKKWVDIEYLDDGNGATCSYTDMQNCSEARKRPFNAEEMKALFGKVIERDKSLSLVTAYYEDSKSITIGNSSVSLNAKLLSFNNFTIDGKPCYVLEHLENGEWVE